MTMTIRTAKRPEKLPVTLMRRIREQAVLDLVTMDTNPAEEVKTIELGLGKWLEGE